MNTHPTTDVKNIPVIETDRLILRKLNVEDADDMYEYASNLKVTRHMTWDEHLSIEQTVFYLLTVEEAYKKRELLDWAVTLKSNKKMIGTCGFTFWNEMHQYTELGYVISHKFQRQGYATECSRALLKLAFTKMDCHRVEAVCFPENTASIKLLEKLNMQREGLLRSRLSKNGIRHNLYMYALLKQS